MPNHPNRGRRTAASNPLPHEIAAARARADMSPSAAGAVLYTSAAAWLRWETGAQRMHPALWELFLWKALGQAPP